MSDIIEAAARALRDNLGPAPLLIILAAVTPLIRNAALEEAAKVAENYRPRNDLKILPSDPTPTCERIAAALRALKEQP